MESDYETRQRKKAEYMLALKAQKEARDRAEAAVPKQEVWKDRPTKEAGKTARERRLEEKKKAFLARKAVVESSPAKGRPPSNINNNVNNNIQYNYNNNSPNATPRSRPIIESNITNDTSLMMPQHQQQQQNLQYLQQQQQQQRMNSYEDAFNRMPQATPPSSPPPINIRSPPQPHRQHRQQPLTPVQHLPLPMDMNNNNNNNHKRKQQEEYARQLANDQQKNNFNNNNNLDNSLPGGGSLFAVGAQADTAALQARKHEQQQEYAAQLQNDKLRHARERDMEIERKMRQDRNNNFNNNFNNNDNNNNNGFAGNNNDDDMNQRNKLAQQAQYAAKLQQDQLLKQKQQRNVSQGSIPGGGMLNIGAADGVRSHSNANNDQALLLKRQKQAEYQRQLDDDKHNNNMNDHNYIYNQKNDFDGGAMQIGDGTAEVNAKKYDQKQEYARMLRQQMAEKEQLEQYNQDNNMRQRGGDGNGYILGHNNNHGMNAHQKQEQQLAYARELARDQFMLQQQKHDQNRNRELGNNNNNSTSIALPGGGNLAIGGNQNDPASKHLAQLEYARHLDEDRKLRRLNSDKDGMLPGGGGLDIGGHHGNDKDRQRAYAMELDRDRMMKQQLIKQKSEVGLDSFGMLGQSVKSEKEAKLAKQMAYKNELNQQVLLKQQQNQQDNLLQQAVAAGEGLMGLGMNNNNRNRPNPLANVPGIGPDGLLLEGWMLGPLGLPVRRESVSPNHKRIVTGASPYPSAMNAPGYNINSGIGHQPYSGQPSLIDQQQDHGLFGPPSTDGETADLGLQAVMTAVDRLGDGKPSVAEIGVAEDQRIAIARIRQQEQARILEDQIRAKAKEKQQALLEEKENERIEALRLDKERQEIQKAFEDEQNESKRKSDEENKRKLELQIAEKKRQKEEEERKREEEERKAEEKAQQQMHERQQQELAEIERERQAAMGLAGKPEPSAIVEEFPSVTIPVIEEDKKETLKSRLFGDDPPSNDLQLEPDTTSTPEIEGVVIEVPDAFRKGGLARTVVNKSQNDNKEKNNKRMLHRSKTTLDDVDDGTSLESFRSLQKQQKEVSSTEVEEKLNEEDSMNQMMNAMRSEMSQAKQQQELAKHELDVLKKAVGPNAHVGMAVDEEEAGIANEVNRRRLQKSSTGISRHSKTSSDRSKGLHRTSTTGGGIHGGMLMIDEEEDSLHRLELMYNKKKGLASQHESPVAVNAPSPMKSAVTSSTITKVDPEVAKAVVAAALAPAGVRSDPEEGLVERLMREASELPTSQSLSPLSKASKSSISSNSLTDRSINRQRQQKKHPQGQLSLPGDSLTYLMNDNAGSNNSSSINNKNHGLSNGQRSMEIVTATTFVYPDGRLERVDPTTGKPFPPPTTTTSTTDGKINGKDMDKGVRDSESDLRSLRRQRKGDNISITSNTTANTTAATATAAATAAKGERDISSIRVSAGGDGVRESQAFQTLAELRKLRQLRADAKKIITSATADTNTTTSPTAGNDDKNSSGDTNKDTNKMGNDGANDFSSFDINKYLTRNAKKLEILAAIPDSLNQDSHANNSDPIGNHDNHVRWSNDLATTIHNTTVAATTTSTSKEHRPGVIDSLYARDVAHDLEMHSLMNMNENNNNISNIRNGDSYGSDVEDINTESSFMRFHREGTPPANAHAPSKSSSSSSSLAMAGMNAVGLGLGLEKTATVLHTGVPVGVPVGAPPLLQKHPMNHTHGHRLLGSPWKKQPMRSHSKDGNILQPSQTDNTSVKVNDHVTLDSHINRNINHNDENLFSYDYSIYGL